MIFHQRSAVLGRSGRRTQSSGVIWGEHGLSVCAAADPDGTAAGCCQLTTLLTVASPLKGDTNGTP